ncbi:MAG: LapA family protein [Burkholderiaceae bacterium]|jgi:uncharacterized integral membrane protein|nr:LapA family protein [Burkholderiaceae bacterium]
MSLRSVSVLIVALVIVVFVASNWPAMTAPTDINLLLAHGHAPLGLILLGLMLLLCAVFVVFVAYLQGTVLLETRRHARELAAQRELADSAEASRITELRGYLEQEITRLSTVVENHANEVLARIDRAEGGLREHPADAPASAQIAASIETLSRDLHARIDRLEMGLRDDMKGDGKPAAAA